MGHHKLHRHTSSVPLPLLVILLLHLGYVNSLYHTSSEILHWFSHSAAKHPSILRFQELRERHTHTFLPVASITAGANENSSTKPVVLFVFGEHAREVITSEVGIWLTRILVDNTSSIYSWPELGQAMQRAQDPSSSSSTSSGGSDGVAEWASKIRSIVSEVLEKLEVQVIPIEALDSRRQVEEGELCVRKTSSNVDLNRNWPFAWHREDPGDEQYGGPGPLSEPQSRLVKQVVDSHDGRLLGYVNVHSGEWALYTPWDSKPAYAPDLPADLPNLVSEIGRLCNCKAGPAGAVSGYLAFGSSMDYVYVHKKVPYPLTVEVYGGGDVGKLQPGDSNKPLTDFPVIVKPVPGSAAAGSPPLHRRGLQQQQQQQRQHQQQQRSGIDSDEEQQCLKEEQQGLINSVLSCVRRKLLLQQQQQQQQGSGDTVLGMMPQQQQRRQQQGAAGSGSSVGADTATAQAAVAEESAGSSYGDRNIPQSRRMALLQLTEQQQQQLAAAEGPGIKNPQQQQQAVAQDGIMDIVVSSDAGKQACFDAFNPRTEEGYRRVVADWVAAFVLMLKHMADSEAYKAISAAAAANSSLIG